MYKSKKPKQGSTFSRFFKIFSFAWKEILLIKSQPIALLLIFLYPILAISALAFALSGASPVDLSFGETNIENVLIGVVLPQSNANFDSVSFRTDLQSFDYLNVVEFTSRDELIQAIRTDRITVGIIIDSPLSETDSIKASFLYDDSAFFASGTILAQTKTAVASIGSKKSSKILYDLIVNLDSISKDVSNQITKVDSISNQLTSTNKQLFDLNDSINAISTNVILNRFSNFDKYYAKSKQYIHETLNDLNEARVSLVKYRAKAVSNRNRIDTEILPLESELNKLYTAAQASPEPAKTELLKIHSKLSVSFNEIKLVRNDLDQAVTDIDDAQNKLNVAETRLLNAENRLDLAKIELGKSIKDIQKIESLIEEAKLLVATTYESKVLISNELANTKTNLIELKSVLTNLKNFNPGSVVSPISMKSEPVYEINQITAMLPAALSLILMLTTLLLASSSVIIEREKGIYSRLKVSPTSHSTWLVGKILGQMFFALIEAVIILSISFFVFGVSIPQNIIGMSSALVLVSFAFICIGLFIPEIMKTQATAILSSLLVLIPMLFLSGMIFPIEFMPLPIDIIAKFMPLTAAVNILTATMIKGFALTSLTDNLIILLVPALVFLTVTLIKNRK